MSHWRPAVIGLKLSPLVLGQPLIGYRQQSFPVLFVVLGIRGLLLQTDRYAKSATYGLMQRRGIAGVGLFNSFSF